MRELVDEEATLIKAPDLRKTLDRLRNLVEASSIASLLIIMAV